eukprot:Skav214534  [mRNA]  locus=scaffold410:425821:445329:+ [translate_table: standard]
MAEKILASIKVSISGKISEAEEKLAKADTEKAAREALKVAEKEQKVGDAESVKDETKKGKLENTINSVFVPCKDGALEKGISELQKLGKELGFDTALLTSLPSALQKDPASRGTFDNVVVTNVEDELQKRLAKLKEILAEAAPAREERANKVATCAGAVETFKTKLESLEKVSKESVAALKEAESKAKAATKALKATREMSSDAFGPEIKATGKALKDAKDGRMARLGRGKEPPSAMDDEDVDVYFAKHDIQSVVSDILYELGYHRPEADRMLVELGPFLANYVERRFGETTTHRREPSGDGLPGYRFEHVCEGLRCCDDRGKQTTELRGQGPMAGDPRRAPGDPREGTHEHRLGTAWGTPVVTAERQDLAAPVMLLELRQLRRKYRHFAAQGQAQQDGLTAGAAGRAYRG